MFKRLKNWILNRPAEDHAIASFAWLGGSCLVASSMIAFPALAPIACSAAIVASEISVIEGIVCGSHIITNFLSWGFKKLFGKKESPITPNAPPNTSKENYQNNNKEIQRQQNNKDTNQINPNEFPGLTKEFTIPTSDTQQNKKPQTIQISSEEFSTLIQRMKALEIEVRRMRQENLALISENKSLRQNYNTSRRTFQRPKTTQKNLVVQQNRVKDNFQTHE